MRHLLYIIQIVIVLYVKLESSARVSGAMAGVQYTAVHVTRRDHPCLQAGSLLLVITLTLF